MRYLVKLGELGQKIENVQEQLASIDENINNLSDIKSNIIWEGEASLVFSEDYENYLNELDYIRENIISSIKYLSYYYNNYSHEYLDMKKRLNNLSDRGI